MNRINQKGFTLLEIIIAIGILAGMVLTMTEVTDGIMLSRNRTDKRNETQHAVAIALNKITADLRPAFQTHKKFHGSDNNFKTGFIADSSSMNFSTMSHVHYVKNKKDTDEVQVGYSLRSNSHGSFDLMRRQTDHLTDDLEAGGKSFALLTSVKEFSLEFYDSNKEVWETAWNSESVSSAGRLPQVVRVRLVVLGEALDADEEDFKEYPYELWVPLVMYGNKIDF